MATPLLRRRNLKSNRSSDIDVFILLGLELDRLILRGFLLPLSFSFSLLFFLYLFSTCFLLYFDKKLKLNRSLESDVATVLD